MVPLAQEIYRTRQVSTVDGSATLPVNSETPEHVAEFLKNLVVQTNARVSAAVGLAYGLSALSIGEGLREDGGGRHIAFDPHQFTQWSGIGLENARRAGFADILELRKAPTHLAVPQLIEEGTRLDFAYIDGWHTSDHALVDFFCSTSSCA